MENNIYFSNISKSFDGKIVLDNISHGFKLNQVHVILGKSGMGKSVLLKMLMGLMKPDSGKILINNINLDDVRIKENFKTSYVFQFSALLNSLSVIDNVTLYLDENNIDTKENRLKKAYKLLNDLGVEQSADKIPSDLSGGMRKRVAIARSLMIEPEILLYDEPTAELDQINTKIIADIVIELKKNSPITQLVVTHDISFALAIADTISILDEGVINLSDSPEIIKKTNHPLLDPIA